MLLSLLHLFAAAQTGFKTIVPQQPIIIGESFQVQYILEDGEKASDVKSPAFSHFRFVTGPNIYKGTVATPMGSKPLRNVVYTLEAVKTGKFLVPGAITSLNGRLIKSNDAWVEVISKGEALKRFDKENALSGSEYLLRPGEDAYSKIEQNLFVKMMVDKRTCFVGEPVLATFKLYSRLESRSDIIKNPGFYGFTVYDMVNLADKQVATESVNGKIFDVHTIRKVQLYPLQAGEFTVDAMQVKNKVEFSRSVVNKKTEQQIAEGVLDNEEGEAPKEGASVFETEIATEPVTIRVKPVPDKNKPLTYGGAIGAFTIASNVDNANLKKNEEGFFAITIMGKGNFIQLSAPAVQWPDGVEGFEPIVKDELNRSSLPLTGSRTFRYPFVCSSPGTWQLPAVSFSYFDIDSNRYQTIVTKLVNVFSSNESKEIPVDQSRKPTIAEKSEQAARTAGIIVVSLVLLILLYWVFKKKEPEKIILNDPPLENPYVDNLLEPAVAAISQEGRLFYQLLHNLIWTVSTQKFGLAGTAMNKQSLAVKMKQAGLDDPATEKLFKVLEECETGMFTNANLRNDRQHILSEAKEVLEKINSL